MKADGTMTMEQQDSIPVPANGKVEFQPAGFHVMLINLPDAINPNDTFPLTLSFQKAGDITVQVTVKEP